MDAIVQRREITIMGEVIICGMCLEPLNISFDTKDDDIVACADCGHADSFGGIKCEVLEFFATREIGDALRGSVVHFAMMRRTEARYSRHGAHHRFTCSS